jgi:hypothetical protein
VEVSEVRRRLRNAIQTARSRAQQRRLEVDAAEQAFATFLEQVATPVARQVANVLKAEGYSFTVFTPGHGLRLASDRTRDDFIEIALDVAGERPQVMGRVSYTRGSRTIDEERPLEPGASPDALREEDVLEFLAQSLEPWLER